MLRASLGVGAPFVNAVMIAIMPMQPLGFSGPVVRLVAALIARLPFVLICPILLIVVVPIGLVCRVVQAVVVVIIGPVRPSSIPGFMRHTFSLLDTYAAYCDQNRQGGKDRFLREFGYGRFPEAKCVDVLPQLGVRWTVFTRQESANDPSPIPTAPHRP